MKVILYSGSIEIYERYDQLNDQKAIQLCKESIAAMSDAYAPYSKFQVGSALRLDSGIIIKGNNQENAVYPLGLCAERVVLYAASSQYPDNHITDLAVATAKELAGDETPPFPCGSCRQVLLEMEQRFGHDITIYVVGGNESVCVINSAKDLLPFAFSKDSL